MELLDCMRAAGKAWALYVFSSANAIRKYDVRELVELGVEWIWLGLESSDTNYAKLKGTDTLTLVRELQAHGICVHGSTIIGLEHHTPENVGTDIDRAVAHEAVFHQFMLYTPMPGTALHAQIAAEGGLLTDVDLADTHGQFKFNFRHAAISRDQSKVLLDRAFRLDLERNGPSLFRLMQTMMQRWRSYRADGDPRVRARVEVAATQLRGGYGAALWAMERYLRAGNPSVTERIRALRLDTEREFGAMTSASIVCSARCCSGHRSVMRGTTRPAGRSSRARSSNDGRKTDRVTQLRSPERVVERHHDRESADEAYRGHVRCSAADGLRNQFLDDDIQHRTRRRGHPVGEERRRCEHKGCADDAGCRFDHRRELSPEECPSTRHAALSKRKGDGQAFGDVLQANADRERGRGTQIASTKADTHSHSFRNIVERHRQHQERRSLPCDARPFHGGLVRKFTVQVWEQLIGDVQKRAAKQQPNGRSEHPATVDRRNKQRPARRRDHHAGSKPHHRVHQASRRRPKEQDGERSDSREQVREGGGNQCLGHRVEGSQRFEHYDPLSPGTVVRRMCNRSALFSPARQSRPRVMM